MLLTIDIGNSRVKMGVFDGDVLHTKIAFSTQLADSTMEMASAVESFSKCPIEAGIACSVVPSITDKVVEFAVSKFGVSVDLVANDAELGLEVCYEPLAAAGTDRLINCFAAAEKYDVPAIVCSFGTATTIDVIDQHRVLRGGLIAPGMRASAMALEAVTAQLPEVLLDEPAEMIAVTTAQAIRSGIYYSQIGLVETCVSRIKGMLGMNARVIATGGFAPLILDRTDVIDILDPELTLEGLRMLYSRRNTASG